MNYDPNLVKDGKQTRQTVELVFQFREYTATKEVVVLGSGMGFGVIDDAIEILHERLEEYSGWKLLLRHPDKEGLLVDLFFYDLASMLVAARIVSIEPAPNK